MCVFVLGVNMLVVVVLGCRSEDSLGAEVRGQPGEVVLLLPYHVGLIGHKSSPLAGSAFDCRAISPSLTRTCLHEELQLALKNPISTRLEKR